MAHHNLELQLKVKEKLKAGEDPKELVLEHCKPHCTALKDKVTTCEAALKVLGGKIPEASCMSRYLRWVECVENCTQPVIFEELKGANMQFPVDPVINTLWATRWFFAPLYPFVRLAIALKRINIIEGSPVE